MKFELRIESQENQSNYKKIQTGDSSSIVHYSQLSRKTLGAHTQRVNKCTALGKGALNVQNRER